MDAQKWHQIASSFSYKEVPKVSQDSPEEFHPFKPNLLKLDTQNPTPVPSKNTLPLMPKVSDSVWESPREITPQGIQKVLAEMNSTIQKLTKLLDEKSQVIQTQEATIAMLQRTLDTCITKKSPDEVSKSLSQPKNTSKDQKLNGEKSKPASSRTKVPEGIISTILDRLEDLEKRMELFAKSIPKRVQLYCEKYLSNCKFRCDDSGEIRIVLETSSQSKSNSNNLEKKPPWERSPLIKPKVNYSSQIRRKSHTAPLEDKQIDSSCNTAGVENYLKHLETIVNDLKVGFVQLLLQRVIEPSNGSCNANTSSRNLNLNRIFSALHN